MRIEVRWRSGKKSVVEGVRANRMFEIDEAKGNGMGIDLKVSEQARYKSDPGIR
jgi:hypothetical protein